MKDKGAAALGRVRGEFSGRTEGKGLGEATEDWTDEGQTAGHGIHVRILHQEHGKL